MRWNRVSEAARPPSSGAPRQTSSPSVACDAWASENIYRHNYDNVAEAAGVANGSRGHSRIACCDRRANARGSRTNDARCAARGRERGWIARGQGERGRPGSSLHRYFRAAAERRASPPGSVPRIEYIDHQQEVSRKFSSFPASRRRICPMARAGPRSVRLTTHNGTHSTRPIITTPP